MSLTPLSDFVAKYAGAAPLRLHVPGHKGRSLLGPEALDITEIPGADVLYHARGVLSESQAIAASLFGAGRTLFSTEGSSLCVRAMGYLALQYAQEAGKKPTILAGRNAHKSFLSAAALLGLEVEWLYGQGLLTCAVTPEELEEALTRSGAAAVYLTSPDYLGNRADIGALAQVCHARGALLLVDNAHGAYLRFLPENEHPLALGADICCDSAHKTLPVLTGGAYLHLSPALPAWLTAQAEGAMALFATTSPSYLILQSLDRANADLAGDYPARLAAFLPRLAAVKARLAEMGYPLVGDEPMKLTLAPQAYGYTGEALGAILAENGIVCELADREHLVMMFTPEVGPRLEQVPMVLGAVPRRPPIRESPPPFRRPEKVLSLRAALLAPTEELPLDACRGRILGQLAVSCPPAVLPAVPGERLDGDTLACFRYYGVETCRVVKEKLC